MNFVTVMAVMALTLWGANKNDLQDLLVSRWFFLLLGCGLVLAWRIGRRFHWTLGFLTLAVMWSGLSGAFLYDKYSGLPVLVQMVVKESAASSLVSFALPALAFLAITPSVLTSLRLALAVLGPMSALIILLSLSIWHATPPAVIQCFDNPSLAGTVVACCLPITMYELWLRRSPFWLDLVMVPMLVSMVLLRTSTQLFAFLGASAFVFLVNSCRGRRGEWKSVAGIWAFLILLGLWWQPWAVWSYHSERWVIWKMGTDMMKGQPWQVQLFGLGLGATHWMLPLWEQKVGYGGPMYFWFHNDWLQIWVEMGIVGLTAALAAFSASIWRCRREPWLLAAVTAYGLSMVTNFTTHWPLEAGIGFILAALVWRHPRVA